MLVLLQQHRPHQAGDRGVVGEDSNDAGASFDFLVHPLQQVGAPDLAPVVLGEVAEGQHVLLGLVHECSGLGEALMHEAARSSQRDSISSALSWANTDRRAAEFKVTMRPGKRRALPEPPDGKLLDVIETVKAHIPSKVEHPFRVIKQQIGFQKTRLRGLAKNRCMINVMAALTNRYLARRHLLATA